MAKMKSGGKPVNNPKTRKGMDGAGRAKKTGGMMDACQGVKPGAKKGKRK